MGLIQRIANFAGFEKRDGTACIDPSWAALSHGYYAPGLSPRGAENLAAVLACVNAISSALASVPALVYRRDGKGDRTEVPTHPLALMYQNGVNDLMQWPDFIELLYASTLLQGNGLATIQRSGSGALEGLTFVPWNTVSVQYLPSRRLAFDITDTLTGRSTRYLQDEVIFLKDRSDDGRIGRSRLSRAAETVDTVSGANALAGSLLKNGAFPSGFLSAPGAISKDTAERLKGIWDGNYSGRNAGKVAVGGDGLKWQSMQISPEDAELLESRKFGAIEICRIFQVPPPLIQDYSNSTFTNSLQAGLWFGQYSLAPWARKLEAEFSRTVFPAGSNIELQFSLDGFLRGDPATRWTNNKIAIDSGVLTADEVRQQEGWNPLTAAQRKQIEDARKSAVPARAFAPGAPG